VFMSTGYSNFTRTNELLQGGNEIADHTVTHTTSLTTTRAVWDQEIGQCQNITKDLALVPLAKIVSLLSGVLLLVVSLFPIRLQ